jgi:hypothetical protein
MAVVDVSASTRQAAGSYVEWSPVIAGAVLASALSFVFLTFGSAIGLSATSPWPNSGLSAKTLASIAIFWALIQQIGAFMAGGYVAGRMRSRWAETGDEADFRDGLHGGLVWAVGVTIAAFILLSAAGATVRTGVEIAGPATSTAAAATKDPMASVLDAMLRPVPVPAPGAPPATAQQPPRPAAAPPQAAETQRAEIGRLVATAATTELSASDRAYLAQLVSQRTGLLQSDAERRVTEAITAARDAADKARRAAVLTGVVAGIGLIISFGAAWWAAMKGGNHRDNAVPPRFPFADRSRPIRPS